MLTDALSALPPVTILGSQNGLAPGAAGALRRGIVTFRYAGIPAHDLGFILDAEHIMVRADGHCQGSRGETESSVRASFHAYTSVAEVRRLVAAVTALG